MTRIACLHSAASNIAVFEAAARDLPGITLRHELREDLLREAEAAGGLTAAIAERTAAALSALATAGDPVLLTCSTLGPAIAGTTALRVDAALAREAAARGGRVVVLCAVETTIGPTRDIFAAAGVAAELRLVPDAWAAFRAGDVTRYHALIRAAAEAALAEGASSVALAQASMAGAAEGDPRILASPAAGLRAALSEAAA
jgi:hypothetical protein